MQVVSLRRLGRRLGCEKVILRQGLLNLQFVSNPDSAYYKSQAFDRVLNYIASNPRRCDLKEVNGRRMMRVLQVQTVKEAVEVLRAMDESQP